MKKSVFTLLLAALMFCSVAMPALADDSFTDVSSAHWAYADIKALTEGGLLNGMGDGTFAPQTALTRAQICAILNRADYTTAAEKATTSTDGLTNAQIYDQIKATGLFTESSGEDPYGNPTKILTATARKHAGLKVVLYHWAGAVLYSQHWTDRKGA